MNFDDLAKLIPNAAWRLREDDVDPQETREWLEALDAVIDAVGPERATFVLKHLLQHARTRRVPLPQVLNTPYLNTISLADQPPFPGNLEIESRLSALVRWNALAMVVRANAVSAELGGHIASYSSAADLFEVGFNHFFRASSQESRGDLVYFQPHSSPGVYARAFLEGRLSAEQLDHYRRETQGTGLSSYPHPWLMPSFWQFPTGSMGIGPLFAIYNARFLRYLQNRALLDTQGRKVWAFVGDGEMDEPESLAGLSIAAREGLDNLIFVVNCNLQRLDGPVRGNGSIIQELEGLFAGAGWNVIKLLWGSDWDPLFARDTQMLLLRAFHETVDGEFQTLSATDGRFNREHFFNKYPELAQLTSHLSDEDIDRLRRGGHDPIKIHAAYHAAANHRGQPTVILAKTKKGYGMGTAGQGRMTGHQQKKLDTQALLEFRDRFGSAAQRRPGRASRIHTAGSRQSRDEVPACTTPQARWIFAGARCFVSGASNARRRGVRPICARSQWQGNVDHDGIRADALGTAEGSRARRAHRADHRRRSAHVRHGRSVSHRRHLLAGRTTVRTRRPGADQLLQGSQERPDSRRRHQRGRRNCIMGRSRHQLFDQRFRDASVLHFLFDVRLSARRRFAVGGGRLAHARFSTGRDRRPHHVIWRGTAAPGWHEPPDRKHDSELPRLRPCFAYELALIVDDGMRRMLSEQQDVFYYVTVMNENYAQPSIPAGYA